MASKKTSTDGKKRELPEAFRQNADRVKAGKKPVKGQGTAKKKRG